MSKSIIRSEYKPIVDLFDKLTGKRSLQQVFYDSIEAFAISIQNAFAIGEQFSENEKRYNQIISGYDSEELTCMSEIFAEMVKLTENNPFRDVLGELYMQLGISCNALGQFFTPYNISYMMSKITTNFDEIKSIISSKGYIIVNEPTCGSGTNIIAFCECLHENGIKYQTQCIAVCQDLSRIPARMCYITLSLLGCSAVIKVGDTLFDPFTSYREEILKKSEIWTTPMFCLTNGQDKI